VIGTAESRLVTAVHACQESRLEAETVEWRENNNVRAEWRRLITGFPVTMDDEATRAKRARGAALKNMMKIGRLKLKVED